MSRTDSTAPNADNEDLPDGVPDPMTDDRDIAEEATDADAADSGEHDIHGDPDQVT